MAKIGDSFGILTREGSSAVLLCAKCKVQVITGLPHICGETIVEAIKRVVAERVRKHLEENVNVVNDIKVN